MRDIRAEKRRLLESAIEALLRDYGAAMRQETETLADADRNRLKRQARGIWERIEEKNQELKELELAPPGVSNAMSSPDPVQVLRELQSKLPEIDFDALVETLHRILDEQQDGGCAAALLLLQNSLQMGGEWCAERVRELLRCKTGEGNFRHIPLEIQPSEYSDAMAPLRRLGHDLGLDSDEMELRLFSEQLVQRLCGSLQHGSIIMIEFRGCDYLSDAPGAFLSMVQNFWRPLVNRLETVAREYLNVKIITLLFVDTVLPDGSIESEYCCTAEQFDRTKLLEIPLVEWTRTDIQAWIATYSGHGRTRSEIERMANHIHRAAGGLPHVVAHGLLKRCAPPFAK